MRCTLLLAALLAGAGLPAAVASDRNTAMITRLAGSVVVGGPEVQPSAANVEQKIAAPEYVRTGNASKCELEFEDKTLTRLGSNTLFTFSTAKRDYRLDQGEAIFVFEKGGKGSTISTAALTAAITGTTVYVKVTRRETTYLCLEGRCKIGPHAMRPGDELKITPGKAAYNAPVTKFHIADFMKKNPLVTSFSDALPSKKLIEAEIARQK